MKNKMKPLLTFNDYQKDIDKVNYIKKLTKPKTPKSYFVSQFLYQGTPQKYDYIDEPLIDSNSYDEFLLIPSNQTHYFDYLNSEPLFCVAQDIWELVEFEKILIEHQYLNEDNDYFNNIKHYIRFVSSSSLIQQAEKQKTMYQFFTMMYLEKPSICSHWNFKDKLTKEQLDELIFSELNNGLKGLKFLISHFSKDDLTNAIHYINDVPLNIKEFFMIKFLMNKSNQKKAYNAIQELIDQSLVLPVNLSYLWKVIQKNQIHYYKLQHLGYNELNSFMVSNIINQKIITDSVENMTKFFTMSRALTILINATNKNALTAAGLNDIPFNNFEEAVHHFFEDPFLKNHMPSFMMEKGNKAQKKENKTRWSYFNLLFKIELDTSTKESKVTKKLKL